MNRYAIHLKLLSLSRFDRELRDVLDPLAAAIESADRKIRDAEKSGDDDYLDMVVDYQAELVEALLGAAFVSAQAQLTSIIARIILIHKHHDSLQTTRLTTSGPSKQDILSYGSALVSSTSYSTVQVIDAFANYFKHHDEWPHGWHPAPPRSKSTLKIIQAVGATDGSTGNMRKAAQAIGISSLANLHPLADAVEVWGTALEQDYSAELRTLCLVT